MIQGEFYIDGRWVRNQFTTQGMQTMLKALFHGDDFTAKIGLCMGIPADDLSYGALIEPTAYTPVTLNRNNADFPQISAVNGESFVETRMVTFPINAPLDVAVDRLYFGGAHLYALSAPIFPTPKVLDSPLHTKYRLYFR